MGKFKILVAVLLTSSMAALGVGCTPPASEAEAQEQAQWDGNFFALVIIKGLCEYTSFCPIPGVPVGPFSPPPADAIPSPPVDTGQG